jgi:DSF synthase
LRDILGMQRSVQKSLGNGQLDYLVFASQNDGIFNLGGDLDLFRSCILRDDRSTLLDYATSCIDVVFQNYQNYDLPIVTIALVQGDALGGGYEAALSCDVIIAERGTRFGFPEVLFNLFPGMGALSLLPRKLGNAKAHRMIDSGRIFLAEELYEMGLVHVLAEAGEGEAAVRAFVQRDSRRHNATVAIHRALRCASPLEYDELRTITRLWVDAAFRLRESDLARMGRLLAAQDRRCGL